MTRYNLITNASFRSNYTGWTSLLGSETLALQSSGGFVGSTCLKVSALTTNGSGIVSNSMEIEPAKADYTASAYLRIAEGATAGSVKLKVVWYDASGSTVGTAASATLTVPADNEWYRIGTTIASTSIPNNTATAKITITPTTSSTITEVYVDAVMFEKATYLQEFYEDFNNVSSTIEDQIAASEPKDSTVLTANKQGLENTIVNNALRKLPAPYISGLKLNADININGLILNTIDENNVVWVCTDVKGWWTLPDPDVPDIGRGLDDGSYNVRGRWKARTITLDGSILPPHADYMPAARSKLIAALSDLVYLGGILYVDEGPIKCSKVYMVGQPEINVKNARGRIDFSIQLRAGDPIKYSWNPQATDGYYTSSLFSYAISGNITNVTIPATGTVRYTTSNSFTVGDYVTIADVNPSGYNTTAVAPVKITAATSTYFEITSAQTGSYVSSTGKAKLAYASTPLANDGNTSVPVIFTVTGPLAAGSVLTNTTNGNQMKFVKQMRPAGFAPTFGTATRSANVATLTSTSTTGHGLFAGDVVNITIVSDPGSFSATSVTIKSVTTNTISYDNTGSDVNATTINSSSAASLISSDVAIIDTYNQTVTYRGIADAGRSIFDANIDWIKLQPGSNVIQVQSADTGVATANTSVTVQYRSGWIG